MDQKIPLTFALLLAARQLSQAEPPEWSGNPDESLTIKTLPGMMRYDTPEITVNRARK